MRTLTLNKYDNLCTKDKWLGKYTEEEKIVAFTAKLEKKKDNNLKLAKLFKAKRLPKGGNTKQLKEGNKKRTPKKEKYDKYV